MTTDLHQSVLGLLMVRMLAFVTRQQRTARCRQLPASASTSAICRHGALVQAATHQHVLRRFPNRPVGICAGRPG